ncbi:MAG: hypothetical protein LBJ71_01215 [Holosporaceae bacterium]|jgi:hypothetical protein|nr:hypothetical protein [Holosporaceae bacterium]
MKKIAVFIFFVYSAVAYTDNPAEVSESKTEEVREKIDHQDSVPSIIKREQIEKKEAVTATVAPNSETIKDRVSLSLICHKNDMCQVKDVRSIKLVPGINRKVFTSLYPGLIEDSLSFRILKNKKISIKSYELIRRNSSREDCLRSAIGGEVFFEAFEGNKLEKGDLLNILGEEKAFLAVIKKDHQYFIVPTNRCVAIGAELQNFSNSDTLYVYFESLNAENPILELNYLTSNISCKHLCRINISPQWDSVDISLEALLKNNTDSDFEDVKVLFDFFELSNIQIQPHNNESPAANAYNISIKKNSSSICVLKSMKEQKVKLEHIVKIASNVLSSSTAKEVPVGNLLMVENITKLGIGTDFVGGELLVYQRFADGQRFLGRHALSSVTNNDALIMEIGTTQDVIAKVQQTDFRKLSEKQSEYGIQVNLQNKKSVESDVHVVIDVNSGWKVTKKNLDMQTDDKPSWKLNLKPNESKDLHFRIRMDG